MPTRTTAIGGTFALNLWCEFQSTDQFLEGVLPTNRHVLQRLLHEQNWHGENAVQTALKKLFKIWIQSNVHPISWQAISQRDFDLVKALKKIEQF